MIDEPNGWLPIYLQRHDEVRRQMASLAVTLTALEASARTVEKRLETLETSVKDRLDTIEKFVGEWRLVRLAARWAALAVGGIAAWFGGLDRLLRP